MAGLRALLRKELLEQWRTLRLPIVAVVFLLVGLMSPLLARFTPELLKAVAGDQFSIQLPPPTAGDAVAQLQKNVGQFGGLIAVLLAMGAVAAEKERGTAALVLSKPAGRGAFLAAKLLSIGLTLLVATAIAAAGAWFYTLVLFEPLPVAGFAMGALLQALTLFAWAAITFLGSTLTRSSVAAAGLGIVAFIAVGIAGAIPPLAKLVPTGLGTPARELSLGAPVGDLLTPLAATLVLIAAVSAAAWAAFRRQEL